LFPQTPFSQCTIGTLSDGVSKTAFLTLEAKSVDIGSSYLSIPTCYAGEPLQAITQVAEDSTGYVSKPRACGCKHPSTQRLTLFPFVTFLGAMGKDLHQLCS
jgi:hypothetical protein